MILSADTHARSTTPISRVDDFLQAQDFKLRFILDLAQKSPPLLVAGDLLHIAKSTPWLEQYLISLFREYGVEIIVVPGQHDLPGHSLEQINQGSIGVLQAAGVIELLTKETSPITYHGWAFWGVAWGEEPNSTMVDRKRQNMLIWHHLVTQDELWPGQEVVQPGRLLRIHPQYQIILTGDNHQTIVFSPSSDLDGKDRLLINPGSMMRSTAAQINHKPCVFRYENDNLEQIFLPIKDDVLDLTELAETKERDGRISAFVERLNSEHEIGLDFHKNLEQFFLTNEVKDNVKKLTWRCLG